MVRNDPVTLDCRSSGEPEPLVEWYKDGIPVEMDANRMLLPDGSLFLLRAMQGRRGSDAGVYWCVASNADGVARSKNATLDIACECSVVFVVAFFLHIELNKQLSNPSFSGSH